jgi:hypothetical protein
MGGEYSAFGEEERRTQVSVGKLDGKKLLDPGVDGRIILKWVFRKWDVGGMDWMELAQDKYRWRALVNAVMNLRVP